MVGVGPTYLMIQDIGNDKIYPVSLDIIQKHFIYGYGRTCHSYQGSTIKDEITIFDWNFFMPVESGYIRRSLEQPI